MHRYAYIIHLYSHWLSFTWPLPLTSSVIQHDARPSLSLQTQVPSPDILSGSDFQEPGGSLQGYSLVLRDVESKNALREAYKPGHSYAGK